MDRPRQPLEIRPYDPGGPAAPTTTHLLGQRVFGQTGTSGGALRFLHADGHGSTRLLGDAAATVAAAFGYGAFGAPTDRGSADLGLRGRWHTREPPFLASALKVPFRCGPLHCA